jgi:hypothetical protein
VYVTGDGKITGLSPHHKKSISTASLDSISRTLTSATTVGRPSFRQGTIAGVLFQMWTACGSNVQGAFHDTMKLGQTMLRDSKKYHIHRLGLSEARTSIIDEYEALLSWTVHWPGQWSRYQRFRKIGPGHHAAALEGFHREIWKYFRHPVKTKERIYDSLEESPDAAGSAQARWQHAQHCIMSPEDSDFLRKHNPLMSENLALNLQFLRTELRLGFANHYSVLFATCHLYNALRQLRLPRRALGGA